MYMDMEFQSVIIARDTYSSDESTPNFATGRSSNFIRLHAVLWFWFRAKTSGASNAPVILVT